MNQESFICDIYDKCGQLYKLRKFVPTLLNLIPTEILAYKGLESTARHIYRYIFGYDVFLTY